MEALRHKHSTEMFCSFMENKPSLQQEKILMNKKSDVTYTLNSNVKKNETIMGISLSHLRSLLDKLGISKGEQRKLNFYDVTKKIKQITENLANSQNRSYVCYVEIQDNEPESKIGVAEYFVSYAWGGNFLHTVQALVDHFQDKNPYLFFDFVCLDQHKIAETNGKMTFDCLEAQFRLTLSRIGKAVIVLTPGQNPLARSRCWCCFEWAQLKLLSIEHWYCVPQEDVLTLIQEMKVGKITFDYYNNIFASIDVMKAIASNETDQKNILKLIQNLGVVQVNDIVLNSIKDWFIKVCKQALQDPTITATENVTILNSYGAIHEALGQFNDALPYYENAVKLAKKIPENEKQIAAQINNLALLLSKKGEDNRAIELHLEALAIDRKIYGDEHPEVATDLNNIALILGKTGNYPGAISLQREALAIQAKTQGVEHPLYASGLSNLAGWFREMGDYERAEFLYREALRIGREKKGEEHSNVATILNNLASLLRNKGDYDGAIKLVREALAIRKKALGDDHPETISSEAWIGDILQAQGKYDEAYPILKTVVEATKRIQGTDHPNTASALNNLAQLLSRKGDYSGAEPLLREAIAIGEKTLGRDHPDVATWLNNLAGLLLRKGDYDGAEALFREAIAILEKYLGNNHSDVASALNNLALLLKKKGNYLKAEQLYREALRINIDSFGSEHQTVATTLNNLAKLLRDTGKNIEARKLGREAYRIDLNVLGPYHPQTQNHQYWNTF